MQGLCIAQHHIITARKRSLGQGNDFTRVCQSVHGGEGDLPPVGVCLLMVCLQEGGWADPLPEPERQAVRILLECFLIQGNFQAIGNPWEGPSGKSSNVFKKC